MSYASQNFNYNSPRILSPLFVIGLSTAFVSAIIAAAIAIPIRAAAHPKSIERSSITFDSIFGDGENRDSPSATKTKSDSAYSDSRVEFVF